MSAAKCDPWPAAPTGANTMNMEAASRNLLDAYFAQHDHRQTVYHQISSFNHFMSVEVPQTILRSCPVRVTGSPDLNLTGTTRAAAGTAGTAIRVSVEGAEDGPATVASTKPGGPLLQAAAPEVGAPPPREVSVQVEFANVQIRKPTNFENNGSITPMFPNDARLRNLTYAAPVYVDIIATYTMRTPHADGSEPTVHTCQRTLPHVQVGRIPVMVGSDFCLLKDTPEKTPREVGECGEDVGGYFIIQGGERVIISQERMSENVPFIFRNNKVRNKETEVIEIKSIGPDNEGAPKSLAVKIVKHAKNAFQPEHIIVSCPRIKAEIPLFVMLRALGVESDRDIIELICGSVDTPYNMIFQECIEEAATVGTQATAHEWLAANLGSGGGSRESFSANTLQNQKPPRVATIREVLAEECLPHIGGADMMYEKAAYIAYMAKKALDVMTGKTPHDDRDAYPNKKVELPGNLMGNLFRYLFGTKVIKDMKTTLTKEIHNGFWKSSGRIEDIINPSNVYKILKSTLVTVGMKSSLATGNFVGGKMGTKAGISQVMNRLTYLSGISHLRRVSTPIEKTGKLLAPRKLHATQFGFVCPCETPEGHAVGVVKNLSSTALATLPMSPEPVVAFLYDVLKMHNLDQVSRRALFEHVRIFINGAWIGVLPFPAATAATEAATAVEQLRAAKRTGRIHPHTGITYKATRREIWINTEGGRLIRPVYNAAAIHELTVNPSAAPAWLMKSAGTPWDEMVRWTTPAGNSLIEFIDPSETENFYLAMRAEDLDADHTHMELHPCTVLGTMASNIPFPDHNQAPRNAYQSAMGKQAMGMYALNFRERMDTMANLLWYSNVPLASPFMSRFYRAQSMPSGHNIVVAIMTYGGYNQEDSVMINRASLDRGLFRSEFYRTYKDEEKKNQASGEEERFCRPDPRTTRHMKLANYAKLGPDGIVPENTYVDQRDVLIGKVAPIRLRGADGAAMAGISHQTLQAMSSVAAAQAVEAAGGKRFRDSSKLMRANESGYVDRIYKGRNGEGYSFVKIRVREERRPEIGDKFASRHGQKGTCGLILEPEDMPYTANGIVPDIIINPHCFVGETLVSQPSGLARRIDSFHVEGLEPVWSWDPATELVHESFSLGRTDRGVRPTIRLTLEDGRTIRCTPDHKFKVRGLDGMAVWKEAGALGFEDRLIMGPRGTEDRVCPLEKDWMLAFGSYTLEMATPVGRDRSLAFARILGYLHTDGCLSYQEARNTYHAVLYMGSALDVKSIMTDVVLLTGRSPKVIDSESATNGAKTFVINLPSPLAIALAHIPGMTIGRRTTQPASYPEFLLDDACPTSILREFLAGSFGGDGWAPYLSGNQFSNVGFSQSICSEFMESLQERMEEMVEMMARVGVEARITRTRVCHMDTASYQSNPRVSVELMVDSNEQFRERIGVRHCVEKLLRLEAACAYEGFCSQVRRQHNAAMATVDASMREVASYPTALQKVKELYTTEKPLNEYYSLLTRTLIGNRRKPGRSTELRVFDYKYMQTAAEWAKAHGCAEWFSKTEYVVDRNAQQLPTYTVGLVRSEEAMPTEVYDIGVAKTHLFLVGGCVVSNCIPSRMTIAHLMETLLGRVGCELGFLGDATPFNPAMTVEKLAALLTEHGVEPHSNEVLYCGYTGKQMPTSIFVGPIFYQRLKHMTADKVHSRAHGPLVMLTRQPAEGRARDGGLRFGEMERDCLIAHGATEFMKERMMECSDNFEIHVCRGCGLIGVANKERNIWKCTGCGNTTDFSQVRIPYAYKLFLQELESMNISSRLLPETRLRAIAEAGAAR
jgi:DNA-directed RNA polymerase II subunit RPB2